MPAPIWRLCGSTTKLVECYVQPTSSTVHMVTVVLGSETFLIECYPDVASAMSRASQVCNGLLERGNWTLVGGTGV